MSSRGVRNLMALPLTKNKKKLFDVASLTYLKLFWFSIVHHRPSTSTVFTLTEHKNYNQGRSVRSARGGGKQMWSPPVGMSSPLKLIVCEILTFPLPLMALPFIQKSFFSKLPLGYVTFLQDVLSGIVFSSSSRESSLHNRL